MTVFVDKNELELEILALAVHDQAYARIVMGICDRASWDHDVAYIAIDQMVKHGEIIDPDLKDHPHVKEALQRPLDRATKEDLEKLCWNHYGITVTDQLRTIMHVAKRKGYRDIWAILLTIVRTMLEILEEDTDPEAS